MPKEVFFERTGVFVETGEETKPATLTVIWNKNDFSYITHIGVELQKPFVFVDSLITDTKDLVEGDIEDGDVEAHTSLWFQLDSWDDYNRLIKSLRRARDAKFGRPE